eukprot:6908426-Prymnesium_polylepis.1
MPSSYSDNTGHRHLQSERGRRPTPCESASSGLLGPRRSTRTTIHEGARHREPSVRNVRNRARVA